MANIYEDFKNNLLLTLETEKASIILKNKDFDRPQKFFIAGDDNEKTYKLMKLITDKFTTIITFEIEKLLCSMCKENNVNYQYDESSRGVFAVEISGKMTNVELKSTTEIINSSKINEILRIYRNYYDKTNQPVTFVFLLKKGIREYKSLDSFSKYPVVKEAIDNNYLSLNLLEDFILKVFGTKEYEKFNTAFKNFSTEINETIGYQITEICSSANKIKLQKELKEKLYSLNYDIIRKERFESSNNDRDINNYNFNVIKQTYLNKKRFEILFGNSDFADSLFTSEWLYQKYQFTDKLDNTFMVAGYLKSIEQLLWGIILQIGEGREISKQIKKDKFDTTTVSEKNIDLIDKTLGSLQHFITNYDNDDFYLNNFGNSKHFVQNYIKSQLKDWRDSYRNGYFHKHNLNDKSKIDSIREETFYLYMLILGSLELSDEDLCRLG